ncbi:MAG: hypothetical protein ACD_80C00068G0001 [uncultured bacterium (gcode 4)]|uniref:Uncharacterized protein n=1 Tax=uncultured bacterium (gcode 4) TaxID=1234023 RepID=K1XJN4_9BACT|nr:MAG: hypothetical protein ACD_80C00068G0001 [uncultured bacterium (gcode 4)]
MISCCLSDLEKSEVECLDLAYCNAFSPSIRFIPVSKCIVIYCDSPLGKVVSVSISGTSTIIPSSVSITFLNPSKSIKA